MIYFKSALMAMFLTVSIAYSAEVISDESGSSNNRDYSNGGYFELGAGLSVKYEKGGDRSLGLNLLLAGAYRFNGFFFDASRGSFDGVSVGYNLWNNNRWDVDLLGSSARGIALGGNDNTDFTTLTEAQRDVALNERNSFYNGAGVRVTGYFGDAIFQYRLVSDIYDNNGVTSSARLGYSWQLKNWTFNSVVGANYASEKTSNYWHGVTEQESTTKYPKYSLGSTLNFIGEVGVSYPITENIVFRSIATYARFDKDKAESPLVTGGYGIRANTSINYVF